MWIYHDGGINMNKLSITERQFLKILAKGMDIEESKDKDISKEVRLESIEYDRRFKTVEMVYEGRVLFPKVDIP